MKRPQKKFFILFLACFLPFSSAVAADRDLDVHFSKARRIVNYLDKIEEIFATKCRIKPQVPKKVPVPKPLPSPAKETKAPIVIAYRDEGKEPGKAPFYDHYTAQKATDYPTRIACSEDMNLDGIMSYIKTTVHRLPRDEERPPEIIPHAFEGGLLLIPGRTRDKANDPVRTSHETRLIKEALNRGQPILAICAGCWQLWEACGGSTCEVIGHSDRRGMMRIGQNGDIVFNVQVHRIAIESQSLLAKAMGAGPHKNLSVNSLHWKAPDARTLPGFLRIGARAVADETLASRSKVEPGTVEAFESLYGAPLLGIQWHPEAYNAKDAAERMPKKHLHLLKFMAQAGAAYKKKQEMLQEFKVKYGENTTQ